MADLEWAAIQVLVVWYLCLSSKNWKFLLLARQIPEMFLLKQLVLHGFQSSMAHDQVSPI